MISLLSLERDEKSSVNRSFSEKSLHSFGSFFNAGKVHGKMVLITYDVS